MNRLKIGVRLNLLALVAVAGLVVVLGISLLRLNSAMLGDVSDATRKQVDTAYSVVKHYQDREAAGELTRDQAQREALAAIDSLRFGETGYFWVQDMRPVMLMHPTTRKLNGQDVSGEKDADGNPLFVNAVNIVRASGAGFMNYRWVKPGETDPLPKVSYVKGFAPWGWIIGSGVYTVDVSAHVRRTALGEGALVLVVILAMAALSVVIGRSISRPINALTDRMSALQAGDTQGEIPGLSRGDEVGAMASALEVFRDTAIAKAAADAAKARADAEQQFVVDTLSQCLAALSEGDLTASIEPEFPAEYRTLRANYNQAVTHLRELVGALSEAIVAIRGGSGQIAQAAEDLARRTESNAASLEETSAAVTNMGGRLRSTAEAAGTTAERTEAAVGIVSTGRSTAENAVEAMNRVSESAKGIDSVIEGLDKIAFQTRVLAMNAAVEAGRAGDAGRGFAVVADLVSALAMRAEEEAKRARDQLTTTQADIGVAVAAVHEVDGVLVDIAQSVGQVHALVDTMATDNRAQSATIGEIATAVDSMDHATQQNAAMVEETSAAARTLAAEVEGLAQRSSQFNVGEQRAARPARAASVRSTPARDLIPAKAAGTTTAIAHGDWASF